MGTPFDYSGRGVECLDWGDEIISWADCPDCKGRGYFLIRPFATGGSNGAGGIHNMTQCKTCRDAYRKAEKEKKEGGGE